MVSLRIQQEYLLVTIEKSVPTIRVSKVIVWCQICQLASRLQRQTISNLFLNSAVIKLFEEMLKNTIMNQCLLSFQIL